MTRYTGHDLAVSWYTAGFGTIWLEDDYRSLDVSESVTDANSTAGNDTYAGHLPTYTDANATYEMVGTTGSGTLHWGRSRRARSARWCGIPKGQPRRCQSTRSGPTSVRATAPIRMPM